MVNYTGILKPEDYVEPRCVICDEPYGSVPEIKPVPQERIITKLDDYMSRRDYDGARRHLLYWLEEARLGNDLRGQLVIRNELAGHFRKTGNRAEALENAQEALKLLDTLDFEGTISSGTTYTNAATVYHAFGEYQSALDLFEKARRVYENTAGTRPELLGGLYNNMGLALAALKQFKDAGGLFEKALEQMSKVPGGELEQAITYLNMADALEAETREKTQAPAGISSAQTRETVYAEEPDVNVAGMQTMKAADGAEISSEAAEADAGDIESIPDDYDQKAQDQINAWLEQAFSLLDHTEAPHDGYYAFVCEKCAPVFSYYGYFLEADELARRAKDIYSTGE